MKKDPDFIFRLCLMLGDALAIVAAFLFAYLIRTHIDSRPYYFESEPLSFALIIALLIPVWWIILAALGLYQKHIFLSHSRGSELGRLLTASAVGVMTIITYDFFQGDNLFPVRTVAVWAFLLCFVLLFLVRTILRAIRRRLVQRTGRGTLRAIIIGNSSNTESLISQIVGFPEDGYSLVGIVAGKRYIPKNLRKFQYSSLKDALKKTKADVIFQTDEVRTEYSYRQAIDHHILYYFVPSDEDLSSQFGQLELIGNTPAILVKVTPLISGSAKFIKRTCDLLFAGLLTIIALIPMGILWLIVKLSAPSAPAIYKQTRLSRYNRKVKIYKFRSMDPRYSGMSPEEAFTAMGKPQLIKKYRDNGDFLKKDPRVTKIGAFLRATSLDELPQLINVIKGDISLVGPRALVPGELRDYGDRSLLLSVKSGLTGLAQVSGRRDISFDERRSLDLYYIQNWSLWMDFQILLRTVSAVLFRRGAK